MRQSPVALPSGPLTAFLLAAGLHCTQPAKAFDITTVAPPAVHLVFAGACDFQVEPGANGHDARVHAYMLDHPAGLIGGHKVQDHRALIQFNQKNVKRPDSVVPCDDNSDCVYYDVGKAPITLSIPTAQGFTVDPTYRAYVPRMEAIDNTLQLDANAHFANLTLGAGTLWASASGLTASIGNGAAQPYHREVGVSIPLDMTASVKEVKITANGEDIVFPYGPGTLIFVRFLSVPSTEVCIPTSHVHWIIDHDFALNYLLAKKLPTNTPWPVPTYRGSGGPIPDKPVSFCVAAQQLTDIILSPPVPAKETVTRKKALKARRVLLPIKVLMSSMGSDCIGSGWPWP